MYSTIEDIEGEFKATQFKADTAVRASQVTSWIKQETAYINGIVSRRYITPITSDYEDAFLILKRICTFRVAERVKNKLEVKSNNSQTDQEVKSANYTRTPNTDLKDIAEGKLLLKDVPLVNSTGGVSSPCEADCDIDACHVFDDSEQQW